MDDKDENASHGDDIPGSSVPDTEDQLSPTIDEPDESLRSENVERDMVTGTSAGLPSPSDVTDEQHADEPKIAAFPDGPAAEPPGADDLNGHAAGGHLDTDASLAAENADDSEPAATPQPAHAPALVLAPAQRAGRLPWLTWHYSAILPVALLALITTLFFALTIDEPGSIAFRVLEDGTGAPLAGIEISVEEKVFTSDAEGIVHIDKTDAALGFRVEGDGFPAVTGTLDPDGGARQQISIPRLASASTAQQAQASNTTLGIGGAGDVEIRVGQQAASSPSATPPVDDPRASTPRAGNVRRAGTGPVEGIVLSEAGDPVQGARVTDGTTLAITGKDGLFSLDRGDIADDASLTVSAPGYGDSTIDAANLDAPLEIALSVQPINAIYMNPNISTTKADVDRLIEIIDTTDANAIVVDIKEELIFYDTQVEFFQDAGTVTPIIDLPALLKKFRDHDIYTIARLVVFKDSLVAENQPDLAVLNNQTGDLWRDMNGVSWVNPMVHDLWEVNSDLAVEAANLGFDEIQYDYVRFPTDGDLTTMDFGVENNQQNREKAINTFLKLSREKLLPTGAKLSADVFGYTLLVDDDLGIGQNFIKMAEYVDYLSPMVYPSHFPNGSIDVDGHPNDFPYETIEVSMRAGRTKLDGNALQIRPWLQDFSFFDLMPYGDDEVRAQIDASEDVGTSGWMLWDPNNEYHPGALDPEESAAKPAATLGRYGRTVSRGRRTRSRPRP